MPLALTWTPVQKLFGVVSPHGLGAAAGFLLGAKLLVDECRRRDFDTEIVIRALTWAAVGAIVGARLDYVLTHTTEFFGHGRSLGRALVDVAKVWQGGLAMFGGFIGGVAAGLPILVRHRVHAWRLLDAAAPGFAVGVVLGRVGDLVIWDHLGDVASGWAKPIGLTIKKGYELAPGFGPSPAQPLPFGTTCAQAAKLKLFYAGCTYHQPALYDFVGALLLLGVLLYLRKRARYRAGVAICLFGAWYGAQRVVIDTTRSIDERLLFGLSSTQLLGAVLAVVCAAALVMIRVRGRGLGEEPGDPLSREAPLSRTVKEAEHADVAGGFTDGDDDQSSEDSAASSAPSA